MENSVGPTMNTNLCRNVDNNVRNYKIGIDRNKQSLGVCVFVVLYFYLGGNLVMGQIAACSYRLHYLSLFVWIFIQPAVKRGQNIQ